MRKGYELNIDQEDFYVQARKITSLLYNIDARIEENIYFLDMRFVTRAVAELGVMRKDVRTQIAKLHEQMYKVNVADYKSMRARFDEYLARSFPFIDKWAPDTYERFFITWCKGLTRKDVPEYLELGRKAAVLYDLRWNIRHLTTKIEPVVKVFEHYNK